MTESFLALLNTHKSLQEKFLLHQEALLNHDITAALSHLQAYEAELRVHMRFEEDELIPIYRRAGEIRGGAVAFFLGEHKRMIESLERSKAMLVRLQGEAPIAATEIIRLFDQQALYKQLVEHHDSREENIFYPTLDRMASAEEKRELLNRMLAEAAA